MIHLVFAIVKLSALVALWGAVRSRKATGVLEGEEVSDNQEVSEEERAPKVHV
jgi:hypothetical protein